MRLSRILVVDDDPGVLKVIQLTLEGYGHDVISTGDPKTVMGLAREEHFDAVILDVMMPEISGWELLETLRREVGTSQIPVVMLSALGEVEHRVRGLRQGADDYLKKPFDPEELVARLEGIIARRPAAGAGLEGTFEVQSFVELIQSLDQGAKTGVLHLRAGEHSGRVELFSGRLTLARFGSLEGREAVLSMVELTTGRFRFGLEDEDSPGPPASDWPEPARVQPILLEAAYLKDSLGQVEEYLPPEEQVLEGRGEIPKIPEDLKEQPMLELFQLLEAHPSSLAELFETFPVAPNRIRLIVASLHKMGAVGSVTGDESTVELSDSLDAAIREFLQTAVFRGFSLEDDASGVRITCWAADSSWDSLAALLLSVPEVLLVDGVGDRPQEIFLRRGGTLHLSHSAGSFILTFALVSQLRLPLQEPSPMGGVLFPDELDSEVWRDLAESLIDNGSSVLVASPPGDQEFLLEVFQDLPRWRHLMEPVQDLEQVLAQLSLILPE